MNFRLLLNNKHASKRSPPIYYLTKTFVYFGGLDYKYNVTLTRACNSRIVYMLYGDELYMLKSNKIYVMLTKMLKNEDFSCFQTLISSIYQANKC